MTTKTIDTAMAALAHIPPASAQYGVPPEEYVVADLLPARAAVIDAAQRWTDAVTARRACEHRNPRREFQTAQADAALNGQDPRAVEDPRPGHAAELEQLRAAEKATEQAVKTRWAEFIRGVVARRDEHLALIEPVLEQAQADALAAFATFLGHRDRLDRGLGLAAWFEGLKPTGNQEAVNTLQGPRTMGPNSVVMWNDRLGKVHSMPAALLRAGMEVWARGLDTMRAARALDVARAKRRAGDKAANTAPVPRGRITVG